MQFMEHILVHNNLASPIQMGLPAPLTTIQLQILDYTKMKHTGLHIRNTHAIPHSINYSTVYSLQLAHLIVLGVQTVD
jgi:hypothetical protein